MKLQKLNIKLLTTRDSYMTIFLPPNRFLLYFSGPWDKTIKKYLLFAQSLSLYCMYQSGRSKVNTARQ